MFSNKTENIFQKLKGGKNIIIIIIVIILNSNLMINHCILQTILRDASTVVDYNN